MAEKNLIEFLILSNPNKKEKQKQLLISGSLSRRVNWLFPEFFSLLLTFEFTDGFILPTLSYFVLIFVVQDII